MSFLPRLSPEEFEDLFKLFRAAIYQVGISPNEARGLQIQLRERLQKIWDAADPKPFPPVTGQERWEENAGYSPSTLATVIASLVCAAEFAKERGEMNTDGEGPIRSHQGSPGTSLL